MVPEEIAKTSKPPAPDSPSAPTIEPKIAVQKNGLPEGVKILPVTPPIIRKRPRLATASEQPAKPTGPSDPASTPVKRRKPGRPKSGRLDVPRRIASSAPAPLPSPPPVTPLPPPLSGPRRMSDLAPPRPTVASKPHSSSGRHHHAAVHHPEGRPSEETHSAPELSAPSTKGRRARAHRVGVPPLHYGPIITFSLRTRTHPRWLALAALGTISLGLASAYAVWLFLHGGGRALADTVTHSGPRLIAEAVLLLAIYYIGRSLGQTAIIYGLTRESDQRPAPLSRQFGVAVNTFGRRLQLDLGFGLGELGLIAVGAILFLTGGTPWPFDANIQLGLLFISYLTILYLLSALAIARGLAGVNLTLTSHRARTAAKLGWRLFSHRVELVGPRLGAVLLEALLAVPLITVGVALVIAAPPAYAPAVTVGAGLLAWLTGALTGVGTAAWWASLYRQLIIADHPGAVVELLSSRQPEDARRGPLALVVAISTLIIAASLALPWLDFSF